MGFEGGGFEVRVEIEGVRVDGEFVDFGVGCCGEIFDGGDVLGFEIYGEFVS